KPEECAIDGPAAYPTTAPATAPTGPHTPAPDSAPSAASPPRRSSAIATEETSERASAPNAIVFFMQIRTFLPASTTEKCGGKSTILGNRRGRRRRHRREYSGVQLCLI